MIQLRVTNVTDITLYSYIVFHMSYMLLRENLRKVGFVQLSTLKGKNNYPLLRANSFKDYLPCW